MSPADASDAETLWSSDPAQLLLAQVRPSSAVRVSATLSNNHHYVLNISPSKSYVRLQNSLQK